MVFQIFNLCDAKVFSANNTFKEERSECIGELSCAHDASGIKGSLSADGAPIVASWA